MTTAAIVALLQLAVQEAPVMIPAMMRLFHQHATPGAVSAAVAQVKVIDPMQHDAIKTMCIAAGLAWPS